MLAQRAVDPHRRIRLLRKGRPSSLWRGGSLCAGPEDAKERSYREGRTKSVDRRRVAIRGSAQKLRRLVDNKHIIHRATEFDHPTKLGVLSRRTLSHARSKEKLEDHLELVRCHCNFVRPHRALRFGRETRTPAMQAGLSTRRLTFREVFVCTCTLLVEKVTIAFRGARTGAADTDVQNALAA